ncbi:hypothetical protein chiPu_0028378, partial [Chiloscyllium punctatum]|nr:hypothetical protein [Chiloscyllium punctatum]
EVRVRRLCADLRARVCQSDADLQTFYFQSPGYTVKEAKKGRRTFYVTGAPRYQHKGQVLVFESRILRDNIVGKQIGSYFGSEVCPVDLDKDGQTDLLLVAAPMYHSPRHGGMVTVYTVDRTVSRPDRRPG